MIPSPTLFGSANHYQIGLQSRIWAVLVTVTALGCAGGENQSPKTEVECGGPDDLLACSEPNLDPQVYVDAALAYFNTMDSRVPLETFPDYSETVARWEWPPWLKLTAWTRENIELTDRLLRAYPSIVEDRDCRAFSEAPFARCRITFYYETHEGRPCPIYEEFAFNEAGQITWIEAWSDLPDLLPLNPANDPWAESANFPRLSSRIPGLGTSDGFIDTTSTAMSEAAAADSDVADFLVRTQDWAGTWAAEAAAAGEEMWAEGCGW